ncbi:MAG: carboxy terminal-processing peptidase, partial [Gammaproteobacteria bacterium]
SLLDLDEYALSEAPKMGQLKITQAQFFRVNGGSTQNRGVEPDIRFPSAGDPQEYGERSLPNALPWTEIDAAKYQPASDLSQMVAVADFQFRNRVTKDEEFGWLLEDIEEYNTEHEEPRVSLLESKRREEMDRKEAKRTARRGEETGPLVDDLDPLAEGEPGDELLEDEEGESDEEDDRPDLMLRESARIVADMFLLGSDGQLLAKQFSLIESAQTPQPLN